MKKIQRTFRLLGLLLLVGIAAMVPVPIIVYQKDKTPKFVLEQVDENEDDSEDENIAGIT